MTVEKNSHYYEARLQKIGQQRFDALMKGRTYEESIYDEDLADRLEAETFLPALTSKIAYNFAPLRAYIEALDTNRDASDDVMLDILYIKDWPVREKGAMVATKMTRPEILAALVEIATDNFGSDIDEWVTWLAAWEADPPPRGYR
jgi:hypothetical protein